MSAPTNNNNNFVVISNSPSFPSKSQVKVSVKDKVQDVALHFMSLLPTSSLEKTTSSLSELLIESRSPKKFAESEKINIEKAAHDDKAMQENQMHAEMYGNKAANLFKLEKLCQTLGYEEGIRAIVPSFKALSHEDVFSCVEKLYPAIKTDWNHFVQFQKNAKGFTLESKAALQAIEKKIAQAFSESTEKSVGDLGIQINDFLMRTKGLLMVRSTGREDTEEMALAGGNKSIAGVEHNLSAVLQALGQVISSYFSEQSFTQRLLAKQDLTQDPLMSVLLQEMIGEKPDSSPTGPEVLRCGVGYTKELGGETPDLTVIEASYGHNDAVVNSSLPTDKYYIYTDGMNHEVILSKHQRLVAHPTANGKTRFVEVDNPKDIANKPALILHQQHQLQRICQFIHTSYGKPMDIEWLFDPVKETFYLVQARPLVQKRIRMDSPIKPSMTDKAWLKEKGKVYQGEMIVHTTGEVLFLTSSEEIIPSKNLNEALDKFLLVERECRMKGIPNPVKAVIIEKTGSALSHPACVFRENGIVVICIIGSHADIFKKRNTLALIDTQQGFLAQLEETTFQEHSPEEIKQIFLKRKLVQEGWYKHPLPAIESLKDVEMTNSFLEDLFQSLELKGYKASYNPKTVSLPTLIDRLTSDDLKNGNNALKDLIILLNSAVRSLAKGKWGGDILHGRAKAILLNAMMIGKDFLKKTNRMQRLHAAKRLEALLHQEASLRILNTDSLRAILEEKKSSKSIEAPQAALTSNTEKNLKILEKRTLERLEKGTQENKNVLLKNLSTPMTDQEVYTCIMTYNTVKVLSLSKNTKESWKFFTDSIASTRSRIANRLLLTVIQYMENKGILGEWLNDEFVKSYQQEKDPILLLEKLFQAIKSLKDLKKEMLRFNENVNFWKSQIPSFSYSKNWEAFETEVVLPLVKFSEEFSTRKMSTLQKRSYLQSILNSVDVFDKCIKTARITSATAQKVEEFYEMLRKYGLVMIHWFYAIPDETFNKWYQNIATAKKIDLEDYRNYILETIAELFSELQGCSENQLEPSLDFNVQAKCVNSGVHFELSEANTLEDFFQLFHQNILASIACHQESIPLNQLPELLQPILGAIESIHTQTLYFNNWYLIKPEKLSEEIAYPLFTTHYNIPVKLHSISLKVIYDCVKKEVELQFNMFGHNMGDRMDKIAQCILVDSLMEQFQFKEYPAYDKATNSLKYTWHFPEELLGKLSPNGIQKTLLKAIKDSLTGNFGTIQIPSLKAVEKNHPKIWQNIVENPSIITNMLKGNFDKEAFDIITRIIATDPQAALPFLETFGVHLSSSEKDIPHVLLNTLIEHVVNEKSEGKLEFGFMLFGTVVKFATVKPVSKIKRLFIELLKNPPTKTFTDELWQEILKNKKALLFDPQQNLEGKAFFLLLLSQLAEYLKTHKKFNELIDCQNYLIQNQQYEGLFPFYQAFAELSEKDQAFSNESSHLLSLLEKQGVTGVPTTLEAFEQAKEITSLESINSGDKVIFCSAILKGYFHGSVMNINYNIKPSEQSIVIKFTGYDGMDAFLLHPAKVRLF